MRGRGGRGCEGFRRTTRSGWFQGLTIVRVDAQLNLPLNGGLNLLLPHTLDAQIVKAEWGGGGVGEGRSHDEAGLALNHRRTPADAASGLTVSGAPAPGGARGLNLSGVLGILESAWECPSPLPHENTGPPPL